MSNTLAVAAVTASLVNHVTRILGDGRPSHIPGALVTTLNPASASLRTGDPLVNIFLFRVAPDANLRNNDLPTRGGDPQAMDRPPVALGLDYLVTFFGDATRLEPQRLLGPVIAGLHAEPVLGPKLIQDTVDHTPWLAGSDLGHQPETVRVTQTIVEPEGLARLWSQLTKTPYQLSVCYQVSGVLLEG